MNLKEIGPSVEGFLDSVIPGLVEVTILLLTALFVLGSRPLVHGLNAFIQRVKSLDEHIDSKVIRETGVLKLVPVGLVVALVLVAVGSHRLFLFAGYHLPGKLAWNETDVLLSCMPKDEVIELWSHYPKVVDITMLPGVIDTEVQKGVAEKHPMLERGFLHHERAAKLAALRLQFVKCLCASSVVLLLVGLRKGIRPYRAMLRTLIVVGVCAAWGAAVVWQQRDAIQQQLFSKISYISLQHQLDLEESSGERASPETVKIMRERIDSRIRWNKEDGNWPFYLRW